LFSAVNSDSHSQKAAAQAGRWIKTWKGTALSIRTHCLADQVDATIGRGGCERLPRWQASWRAKERLTNPHVLIRPFVRREAVFSSRIEGTQSTLGELLAAEAGAAVERSPDDLREVGNYVVALEYGIERLKTLPLSLRLVRELHEKLMTGARGQHATPGEFRRTQNWIGVLVTRWRKRLRSATTRFARRALVRMGEVPARPDAAAACSCGASSLSIRDHSPVSGRQWPGRAVAHNA